MAKKSKKKQIHKEKPAAITEKPSISELLDRPRNIIIFFIVLFIGIVLFYKPLAIDGLEVTGSDMVSGIGKTHQLKLFEKETGKRPLWNPYMFGGMPFYQRYGPVVWSLDTVLNKLDVLIDWRVWYLWAAALAMFLLVKFLGLNVLAAMMAAVAFILMPHFQALIIVGHFAKFRALMWIPLILLTFLVLLKRRDFFSMLLFALAFSFQMRTQHYQIIFYTLLLLLFMGTGPYLRLATGKNWNAFIKLSGLVAASVVLVILIVAQPLFVIKEYAPYSTRGGNAVSIEEKQSEQDKQGVGFDYATRWSYSVDEFWNLIIPKFHGGTSQEVYTGDSVPQLKNRTIPAYWGSMPFTQSYEYLGIILVFLAFVAIFFCWDRVEVKGLLFLTIFALVLSLGKNLAVLYKLFFYYLPYFDKFRAPQMILTLVMFNTTLLAAFGIDFLLRGDLNEKKTTIKLYALGGVFLFFVLIPLLFGSNFALSQPGEIQRYSGQYGPEGAQQIMEMMKKARLDILTGSALRSLLFLALSLIILLILKNGWLKKDLAVMILVGVIFLDLGFISKSYIKGKFRDPKRIEARAYAENALDAIIKKDKTLFRLSPPMRDLGNDTRWCYFYQSVGGYSPAKLQEIQDLIENNFIGWPDPAMPLNLNVFGMLNTKYIVETQRLSHPDLQFAGSDINQKLNLYLNNKVLPRAFFVKEVRQYSDGAERLKFMNTEEFKPAEMALLEEELPGPVSAPDSSSAKVTHFEPDKIELKVFTDKKALMVVSEVYYPKGWRATLENGEELKIYKTNHILRSVVVPSGKHTITMVFHPSTFYAGIKISLVGLLITYLGILFFIYRQYGSNILGWFKRT